MIIELGIFCKLLLTFSPCAECKTVRIASALSRLHLLSRRSCAILLYRYRYRYRYRYIITAIATSNAKSKAKKNKTQYPKPKKKHTRAHA